MPKGAIILPSFYEVIRDLPDADRLIMYDALVRYGLYQEEMELPSHLRGFFILMKPTMDSSRRKYAAAVENGKKGGRPPKNQTENHRENQKKNQSGNQNQNHDYDLDSESDSDVDSDIPVVLEDMCDLSPGSEPAPWTDRGQK